MQIADQQDKKAKDPSLRQLLHWIGVLTARAAEDCDLFGPGTNAVQPGEFTPSAGALMCNETLAARRSQ